jgi:glycosyltransferase involved in cell wall biosynthesis
VLLPRIAGGAKLVITVSEFARAELRELLGVDARVVPGGVDERFTPDADPEPVKRKYALDRPYVLTVASRTTRKNLGVLTPVADALAADGIEIVAAGGDRPQFRAPHGAAVRPLGHVDDDLLPGLYAGAAAFVLPSLYEGFGLTCLEAMASGTPVVAADRAALPETCGDAALLVDPTDAQQIEHALREAIGNDDLRNRGMQRAAGFTWDQTARAVDDLLRR